VEVSSDGARVSVSGETVSRLGSALVDALSPFTNSLGLVGDSLGFARDILEYRRNNLLRTLALTHEKLSADGEAAERVDRKFMLDWIEGAASEESKEISELWAGLLAGAAREGVQVPASYAFVLSKIGIVEAQLLQEFATDTSPGVGLHYNAVRETGIWSEASRENIEQLLATKPSIREIVDRFEMIVRQRSDRLLRVAHEGFGGLPLLSNFAKRNHRHVVALQREGLVEERTTCIVTSFGEFEVTECVLSQFGFDFVWACNGVDTSSSTIFYEAPKNAD